MGAPHDDAMPGRCPDVLTDVIPRSIGQAQLVESDPEVDQLWLQHQC
jgi:hypothetical protein